MKKLLSVVATFAASFCGFAATHTIENLSDHAGVNKYLKVKAGDTIQLPELTDGGSYKAINTRILSVEGNVATVIAPGIVGLQQVDGDGNATVTAAILSVPDPIGNGRVYLWYKDHWDSGNWCSNESPVWELLDGEEESDKDYPHLPNDIAILARYNEHGFEISIANDISLGGLMIGAYTFDKNGDDYRFAVRGVEDETKKLTFSRTDGEAAWIKCYPGGNSANGNNRILVSFCEKGNATRPLEVVCDSDVVCDLGWDGVDPVGCVAKLVFYGLSKLTIPEECSLTFVNGSPRTDGGYFNIVECLGALSGAGRFVNRAHAAIKIDFDATDFTGTFVEASEALTSYDRNAHLFTQNSDKFPNAGLEFDGFVNMKLDQNGRPVYVAQGGAGYFLSGSNHNWPERKDIGNRLPAREVRSLGGTLQLMHENCTWTVLPNIEYSTELLALDTGFLYIDISQPDNENYPPIAFAATNCVHTYPASATVNCDTLWARDSARVRAWGSLYCPWYATQAVGGILPWFTAKETSFYENGNVGFLAFPYCDANGYLIASNIVGGDLNDFESGANAYVEDNKSVWISEDKTVNSLIMNNPNSNDGRCLGEGHTLTIASGGLIFNCGATRLGDWKWGTKANELKTDCGTVEFGDTAYVYANNQTEERPNVIVAKIIATKGFVAAYPGFLAIVGDQTGIDREVVVTAGSLLLGCKINGEGNNSLAQANVDFGCKIDVPVRIVGGGATLKINKANDQTLDPTQNVYFDDIGGYAGKLVIPEGSTESCAKCYVDNVALNRGIYGATGSGAANIDDDHFSGLGVLNVLKDDHSGLQIYLR